MITTRLQALSFLWKETARMCVVWSSAVRNPQQKTPESLKPAACFPVLCVQMRVVFTGLPLLRFESGRGVSRNQKQSSHWMHVAESCRGKATESDRTKTKEKSVSGPLKRDLKNPWKRGSDCCPLFTVTNKDKDSKAYSAKSLHF